MGKQQLYVRILVLSFIAMWLAACGNSNSNGLDTAETVTLSGTVASSQSSGLQTVMAQPAALPAGLAVKAINEEGVASQSQTVNTISGQFSIEVQSGHDYVVIFLDNGSMTDVLLYGSSQQSVFTVAVGTSQLNLGTITLNPDLHTASTEEELELSDTEFNADNDNDKIPDEFDEDDDNDGIADDTDEHPVDHDNDGIDDANDSDDDNDGINDIDDEHPNDHDNDGIDDANDADDDNDGIDDNADDALLGDATLGASLYEVNACGTCHGIDGTGTDLVPESIRFEDAEEIAETLALGKTEDGTTMTAYPDLIDSAADIAAFLSSESATDPVPTPDPAPTPDPGPDAANGEALYAANNCSACHGADGSTPINVTNAGLSAVTSALQNGVGSMPSYPDLAGAAADIQAFLTQGI